MAVEWIHRYNTLIPLSSNHTIKPQSVSERLALMSTKILNVSLQQNSAVQKNLSTSPFDPGTWITILLYMIIFLLAVIGNFLVILTLIQSRRMRTITNLFLLNLAVSDLLLGIFCMPFTLIGKILRDFIFGEIMCRLLPYLQGV